MWKMSDNAEPAAWLTDVNSFLASALCHMMVLVLLGVASLYGGSGMKGGEFTVELADNASLPSGDDVGWGSDPNAATVAAEATAAPEVRAELDPQAVPAAATEPDVAAIDTSLAVGEIFDEAATREMLDSSLASKSGRGGGGIGPARVGRGDGGDGKFPGKAATDFFGVSGYGQVFVYVVDCSGSMSDDGKFERARYELLQSLEQLSEDQRYYVIFYNHNAFPMEAKEPVAATPKEFEKTRRWIDLAVPSGRTAPLEALIQALSFKPDAVYFLSDGLFDPQTVNQLRVRNRRGRKQQIPIHTIAFVNHEAEGQMRAIAHNSGGEYRFVQ